MDLLEELHRDGATIVMVTHDPELAVRAQREVHIVDGQVVDLARQPRLVVSAQRARLRGQPCSPTISAWRCAA